MSTALSRFAEKLNAAKERIGGPKLPAQLSHVPAPSAPPVAASPSKPPADNPLADRGNAAKYRVTSAIPAGARVAGDLVLEESAIIGGTVDGRVSIAGQGMAAFIKHGGVARGGVRASIVLVYGEVYGLIEAEYVRVYPGGRVEGVIHAESMLVDKGALLLNDHMQIAPPIASSSKSTIDIRPMIRPATAAESRTLEEAVATVRTQST